MKVLGIVLNLDSITGNAVETTGISTTSSMSGFYVRDISCN